MGAALQKRIKQRSFRSSVQEAVLNLLVSADFVRTEVDTLCLDFRITAAQYNVLRILRGAYPDGYPRCEVIDRMLEHAPDVTRLVNRLEANGFVERDRSTRDRRLSITRISKKGLTLLERIEPRMISFEESLAQRLDQHECSELSRLCERIYSNPTP